MKVTDEFVYDALYHWRIEDGLSWSFCKGILEQYYGVKLPIATIKAKFERHKGSSDRDVIDDEN